MDRLERQKVVLEANRGTLAGQRGQRVGQRVENQCVVLVGVLYERPAVVDVDADTRALVGVVWVVLLAQLHELGIDLDGIACFAPSDSATDTSFPVPAPMTSTFERDPLGDVIVGKEIEPLDGMQGLDRVQGLVGDVVP